jgi:zinc protease
MIAESVYAQDSQTTLARWYGAAISVGQSVDDVRAWPDRIRAVTAEQVRDAARNWLQKKRSVTGYLVKDTTATATRREEKRS